MGCAAFMLSRLISLNPQKISLEQAKIYGKVYKKQMELLLGKYLKLGHIYSLNFHRFFTNDPGEELNNAVMKYGSSVF